MKKILITGAAGFVGSNLAAKLFLKGYGINAVDNFSTGFKKNVPKFIYMHDLDLCEDNLDKIFEGVDCVIHLAALADISENKNNYRECLKKNVHMTNRILEACVEHNVKKLLFASTCSVYGDTTIFPTREDQVSNQTSVYSATKIASEKLIEGFANTFGFKAYSMRFVSMIGKKYSHGHIYDFVKKINDGASSLNILGNGNQLKSYLHIEDAIDAICMLIEHGAKNNYEEYNIAHTDAIRLIYSVETIIEKMNYKGEVVYGTEASGWIGDNPIIIPSIEKIKTLGWEPKRSIKTGIIDTIEWILENPWVYSNSFK